MASSPSSFVFDEDDPPLLPALPADHGTASPSFPTGELDFDAFVGASPSGGHTGDDVIMSTIAMLNKIDTSGKSDSKDIQTSILRISRNELDQMCRGVIGGSNGSRFCTRVGCAVLSHKQKADICPTTDEEYYICGLRPNQAFTIPHVPVEWIEGGNEQSMIESSSKPPAVWKLFFQRLEVSTTSANDGDKSSASGFKATQELGNISTAKEQLKTPKRPVRTRLSDIMEAAIDTQAALLPKRKRLVWFEDVVKTEDSVKARVAQLGIILKQWIEVILQLETLQDNYNKRVIDDQAFREKLVRANFDLQLAINQAEDMGRLLQSDIGSPVINLDGMSLWDVPERLIADGSTIKRDVGDLKSKEEDITVLKKTVSQLQYTSSKLTAWIKTQHERGNKVDIMEDNLKKV